ncbi:hypothetical protein JYU34_020514 [Plutella xylostella]|uniref:Uncharacterized protein n=2 Tax=Plutella xylostella TaxID=51655 RepID=A0ABQ7PUL6_PLUXY|nr:hypothetical protein JYU34_020514 [Plutella xylostella]
MLPDFEVETKPLDFIHSIDNEWRVLACGKTQDQLDLTQLAHQFLRKTALKPRSLNFI